MLRIEKKLDQNNNKFVNTLLWVGISILGIVVFILKVLLAPLFYLLNTKSRRWKREYDQYLKTIEGTKFFCYTNKRKTRAFIESQVLPRLNDDIHILFLEGYRLHTKYNEDFLKYAVWRKPLPCLLKVENGTVTYRSVNDENKMRGLLSMLETEGALKN